MLRLDAFKFALAGNAVFTVVSRLTGNRFTYKVTRQDDNSPWYRVGVLTGPDNMTNYTYIGSIGWDRERYPDPKFFSRRGVEAPPSARGMEWLVKTAFTNDNAWERVDFHHAGRCGRCGRTLTVPSSIETGFGPECANKV